MQQDSKPKASQLPVLLSIAAILFAAQGAWMLAPYIPATRAASASKHWPTTSGRMLSTEFVKVPSGACR